MAKSFETSTETEKNFSRLIVPVSKFHICKKQPQFVYECMEILGGNGYTEDWPLARMFRASPLNSIWEGSGNVIALDVLRGLKGEGCLSALEEELEIGVDSQLDRAIKNLKKLLKNLKDEQAQRNARKICNDIAVIIQCQEIVKAVDKGWVDEKVVIRFMETRLGRGNIYGIL
ncbi:hypothetical protein TL16_g05143 [Triparma laevis f. inornata]|uniref:Acyl-CoA dehydrogenase/oxidase C-terminal domain-containing protein n=2 Tax=Triparma laevis TaxID=1534972 RepID=A0A9W7C401_9STRA|nr:hypothetical protein TL16_g05143 [Triparma laevis f. inornata]GMI01527.1 hypothetical protein TrLO_g10201 [Triparma laevis f. longispina]